MNYNEATAVAYEGLEGILSFLRPGSRAVSEVAQDDRVL